MSIDPILTETAQALGEDAGNSIDQVCRDVMVAGTNVRYSSTATSRGGVASGMVITASEIRKCTRTLRAQNARPVTRQNTFAALCHPNTHYDLESDTTITNAFQYAHDRGPDNPLFTGEIGSVLGVTFIESTNAKVFTSLGQSGQDVYATLFIGADAYGVTEVDGHSLETYYKPKGSAGTADPLSQIWTLGWKVSFAAVILNQNWMVRLEHAVSP